jgi:hypothetical protein
MLISRFQVIAGVTALGFATASAFADDLYPPKGMPVGGFRIFPTLDLIGTYDDNVYKQDVHEISSVYLLERPEVRIASQWVRHELDIYGGGEFFEYTDTPTENITNWNFGGNGRVDIYNGVDFIADASFQVLHEPRTDPDINAVPLFPARPNLYKRGLVDWALEYHPYHFSFSAGGSFQRLDYDPTKLVGGTLFSNRDRNSTLVSGFVSAGYEFSPGYAAFIRGSYNSRSFDTPVNRDLIDETSTGFAIDGGLDMRVTNLITGNVYVGYLQQDYKHGLGNVSGFDYGAKLTWTPDELWIVTIDASRTINNTVVNSAVAEDDSSIKVTADLNVRPYLIVEGQVYYLNTDFSDPSHLSLSNRNDNYVGFGLSAKYLINEYMAVRAGYNYESRSSNALPILGLKQDFTDNQFHVALLLQE